MSETQPYVSLAIVVPVYNEAATIETSCKAFVEIAQQYKGRAAIIAIDDGSSDGSDLILDKIAAENDLMNWEQHESNQGYGAAVRTGAKWALNNDFDYVSFIDSDLTNPPEDLLKIGELATGGAPYIKASRFEEGGRMEGVPFRRRVFSRVGNLVGSLLFGQRIKDVTNGFRAVRTELYCSWNLHEPGFPIIMEEVYWAVRQQKKIVSFPTVLRSRQEHQRSTSFLYTPRVIWEYLKYPLRSFAHRCRVGRNRKNYR